MSFSTFRNYLKKCYAKKKKLLNDLTKKPAALWLAVSSAENNQP